jgi:UDP-N-acetyl-D-mannosaminuronate dehydrogenase
LSNHNGGETILNGATLVVGIGEVGGALASVLERRGYVLRHDLERREFTEQIAVMHLCVPFKEQREFKAIGLSYIERFKPSLTIINSTVLPGTTRAIAEASGTPVAYSPVRGKHFRMQEDLMRYTKFVAAPDPATAELAQAHFQQAGLKTDRLDPPEILELAKLAETSYFGLLIAFAQELNRYAERVGGEYSDATKLFDEVEFLPQWRFFPGFIGGHCVVPNIHLLMKIAPSRLLEAVLDSNVRRVYELEAEEPEPSTQRKA